MTEVDTAFLNLSERVYGLTRTLDIRMFGWTGMQGELAEYQPTAPPTIHYSSSLTDRERVLAFIHELGHMCLHPPGTNDNPDGDHDPVEERAVHTAASEVCASYGVTDYREAFASHGLEIKPVTADDPDQRVLVDTIVRRLTDALAQPDKDPGWVPND